MQIVGFYLYKIRDKYEERRLIMRENGLKLCIRPFLVVVLLGNG